MAEETATTPTPTEGDQATEPQGTETDWKAESRKWEQRAKDNKRALDELQKTLEGFEAKKATEEAREQRATEALEAAKAEIKRLQAEAERDRTARDVAKAKGVDPDVLTRMRGDTKDEIEANAELLAQSTKARWPEVKDKGAQKAPGMTRDQILAIKNPKEQLRAAARNLSAFD